MVLPLCPAVCQENGSNGLRPTAVMAEQERDVLGTVSELKREGPWTTDGGVKPGKRSRGLNHAHLHVVTPVHPVWKAQ